MPTLVIHGIGQHNLAEFQIFFTDVRDRLRESVAKSRGYSMIEQAFFPVFWGDWGPAAWYQGLELPAAAPISSAAPAISSATPSAFHSVFQPDAPSGTRSSAPR